METQTQQKYRVRVNLVILPVRKRGRLVENDRVMSTYTHTANGSTVTSMFPRMYLVEYTVYSGNRTRDVVKEMTACSESHVRERLTAGNIINYPKITFLFDLELAESCETAQDGVQDESEWELGFNL